MASGYPRSIEVYECSDGTLLRQRSQAEYHEERLDGAACATKLLREGMSLGQALRSVGFLPHDYLPELDDVFVTTKLVISHWQCRDEPGYAPQTVHSNGLIHVWGNAGSWSGYFGQDCTATDIARYWQETKRRLATAPKQEDEHG